MPKGCSFRFFNLSRERKGLTESIADDIITTEVEKNEKIS